MRKAILLALAVFFCVVNSSEAFWIWNPKTKEFKNPKWSAKDSPQERETAEHILTSMLKRVDISVYLTGKDLIDTGKVTGGYHAFALADDGVGYAVNDFNRAKLSGVMTRVEEAKKKIMSGEIVVPDDDSKVEAWARDMF